MKYPHARAVITMRATALHGSLTHFASLVGVSRQTLYQRIKLASESENTHSWFEFVLHLDPGALEGEPDAGLLRLRPSPTDIAYSLAASDRAWATRKLRGVP